MTDGTSDAAARLGALRKNCLGHLLTKRQQCVWAAVALGFKDTETGAVLGLSAETVRGHVRTLMHALFDGTTLEPSRPLLATLFWLHAECCTRGLLRSIEMGSVFPE